MTRTSWLAVALAVSLAINLLAATFVAGAWSQRGASLNVGGLLPGGSALRQEVRAALAERRGDIAQALGQAAASPPDCPGDGQHPRLRQVGHAGCNG